MSQTIIYPQGVAEITVPAAQSIAISNFGGGIAKIYYLIDKPSFPPAYQFQQTLEDSSVTLGAFSVQTVVKIESGNSKAVYDVGSSPDTGIGDADTLGGQLPAYYTNANNISAGTLADTRLPGTISSDITGNAATATNASAVGGAATATASTASTVAVRDASGDLTANVLISDVAIGTAPLTVTSTTKVANLNADLLDDLNTATASTASTVAARDAGGNLTANVLVSDVATGTAPLTVTSTTVVPNLNVSSLSGLASSQFMRSDTNDEAAGVITLSSNIAFPLQITGTNNGKMRLSGSATPYIYFQENITNKAYLIWRTEGLFEIHNEEDGSAIRVKGDLDFTPDNGANYYSIYHENNCELPNGVSGSFTTTDGKTVTVTSGVITAIV
jgi:hypothetical protein